MNFKWLNVALILFALVAASPVCTGMEDADVPLVVVWKLSPTESAGSSIWSGPVSIPRFVNLKNRGMATQQSEVRLAYDDANLYVAFRCFEEDMARLSAEYAKHDDPVWRDDSIEIFLDTQRDEKTYFHLVANAGAAKFEKRGTPVTPESWDGEWSVDVRKEERAWTALVTIPFRSMGVAIPRVGTVWSANFGRHELPHAEISSWSPVESSFVEPESFGHIVFGGPDALIASVSPIDIGAPGKHEIAVQVFNPTSGPVELRAEITRDGKLLGKTKHTVSTGKNEWRFDFDFPYEGKHKLAVAIINSAKDRLVMRTPPIPVKIPAYRARLSEFQRIVDALRPDSPATKDEKAVVEMSLASAARFAQTAEGSSEKWTQLGNRLRGMEKSVSRLRYSCADTNGRGYVVGTETPLRKILRDKFFQGTLGRPAKISVCRNEYEAVQVVVIAYDRALQNVSVAVSALKGPGGAVIPAERVALNVVDYVETRKPRYEVEYVGWYPDPLMDMKAFDVAVGGIQPIWINVHPSSETPAGTYRGQVIVKPGDAPTTTIPIEVEVWDFTLPTEPHLKTAFALFGYEIGAWYGDITQEIRRAYYEFMLEHRLNPTNIYTRSPIPAKEDLPFCVERGLNAFCLAYTHNKAKEERAELLKMLRDYESFLKEKGWWDKAYIYGFDEIAPPKYTELRDMYGWLKEQLPDLPRACTVIPNEDLKGYVDIWVPVTSNYKQKDAEAYTNAGDEVWWYVCCNPHHPYPNFFVDYPAIDPRIIFWMNWKYRVPGFLYYTVNHWMTNRAIGGLPSNHYAHEDPQVREAVKAGKRWPEVPWNTFTFSDFNGDGHLIYPGPDGKPISSIRLECIRDGIEDYEYFYLLNDLLNRAEESSAKVDPALLSKARKLLAVKDEVVKSLTEYTLDPAVLLKARQQVAETIIRLQAQIQRARAPQ